MHPQLHLSKELPFGWWNKQPTALTDKAAELIAAGNLRGAALVLTRLEDPKAELVGIASCFASASTLPQVVAKDRYGAPLEPDVSRARSIISECKRYMTSDTPWRKHLDEGAAALESGKYDQALDAFGTLAYGHKDRWAHELVTICAEAPYYLGDLKGTIAAFKDIDEPRAWRFQALDLLKTTYASFGGMEPTAAELAARLQAALPVTVDSAVLLAHVETFLKASKEAQPRDDRRRDASVDLVSSKGTAKPGAGGIPEVFNQPGSPMGLLAAALKQKSPTPADSLRTALRAHDEVASDPLKLALALTAASRAGDQATYDELTKSARHFGTLPR